MSKPSTSCKRSQPPEDGDISRKKPCNERSAAPWPGSHNDTMVHVFSFLATRHLLRLRRVSRFSKTLVEKHHRQLWDKKHYIPRSPRRLRIVCNSAPYLRSVTIPRRCIDFSPLLALKDLERIVLQKHLPLPGLLTRENFPHLKWLEYASSESESENIFTLTNNRRGILTDAEVSKFADVIDLQLPVNHTMVSIDARMMCVLLSNLELMCAHFPKLEALNLGRVVSGGENWMDSVYCSLLGLPIVVEFTNLRVLSLEVEDLSDDLEVDQAVEVLIEHPTFNLRVELLHLYYVAQRLADALTRRIVHECPVLVSLVLDCGDGPVTQEAWQNRTVISPGDKGCMFTLVDAPEEFRHRILHLALGDAGNAEGGVEIENHQVQLRRGQLARRFPRLVPSESYSDEALNASSWMEEDRLVPNPFTNLTEIPRYGRILDFGDFRPLLTYLAELKHHAEFVLTPTDKEQLQSAAFVEIDHERA